MWKGGKIGYVPVVIVSTVKTAQALSSAFLTVDTMTTGAWALIDTGCSADFVLDEAQFNKLCTNARSLHTMQGIHADPVPAFFSDGMLLVLRGNLAVNLHVLL